MSLTYRSSFGILSLSCLLLFGISLGLEYFIGLMPCPLCFIQRYIMLLIGLFALVAALHNPKHRGRYFYCGLNIFIASLGLLTAGRQLFIQSLPADRVGGCLPDMSFLFSQFPIFDALSLIFQGTADCAKVDWTLMGLSISHWTTMAFLLMIIHCFVWVRRVYRA